MKTKFTIYDVLIFLTILFQGSNHLKIFPSPFFKYMISLLFILLVFKNIKEKKIPKINIFIIITLFILYLYSIIVSLDKRLVVPMIFFIIEIYTFKMYIDLFETKEALFERILKIILISASLISIIGFIQIIGYKLNIWFLYNYEWMGIIPNYDGYLSEGRFYSIYDEPAHLCTILSAGIFASYYFMKKYKIYTKYIIQMLLITSFGILTGSVITYVTMIMFGMYILFYNIYIENKKISIKQIVIFAIIIILITIFAINKPHVLKNAVEKINNFFSNNVNSVNAQNNTTFALKSNFLISTNKIKDGYIIGSGIFTHEFFYYDYIDKIYPSRYQIYLNYSDAASIFIRFISEFGILSIALFSLIIIYICKSFARKDYIGLFYILLFITQGMRLGDYTWLFNCLPIVIILSNLKFIKNKEDKKDKENV